RLGRKPKFGPSNISPRRLRAREDAHRRRFPNLKSQEKHMQHVAAETLVGPLQDRIDPTAPPRSGDGRQPSSALNGGLVLLDPMGAEKAARLVRRLLAGFPNLGAHDPEGYIAVLTKAMSEYPHWAGQEVIVRVGQTENAQFPPSERTLRAWLDA